MPRTSYIETHVDFTRIGDDLGAIEPPTITLREILERLQTQLEKARRNGATWEQMSSTLRANKVDASPKALREFLEGADTGKAAAATARRSADTPAAPTSPATLV